MERTSNSGRSWTAEEDEAIKVMAGLGASTEDIAKTLKRTSKAVYQHRYACRTLAEDKGEKVDPKPGTTKRASKADLDALGDRLVNVESGIGALVAIQKEQLVALRSIADSLAKL